MSIDSRLNCQRKAAGSLDFIKDHGTVQARDESLGIALGCGKCRGIIQRKITSWMPKRRKRLGKGALTRLPSALNEHDWTVLEGCQDGTGKMAGKLSHG